MKDLILSTVYNLDIAGVSPFIRSLTETGFSGELALFVNHIDQATRDWLSSYATLFPFEADGVTQTGMWRRFYFYREFLRAHGGNYRRILLTDLRDVVFQSDPLAEDHTGDQLGVFLEDRSHTVGTCPVTRANLLQYFGEKVLARIADRPICCAGTTMGRADRMMDYLNALLALAPKDQVVLHAADQAIHNYMIHNHLLPGLRFFENEEGPVLTMGYKPPDSILQDDQGRIWNANGRVPAILHQYDRHPGLARMLINRYREEFASV